jgi:serine protease
MKAGKAVLSACACVLILMVAPVAALAVAPNDPLYAQQWALSGSTASINAAQAWCSSLGGVLIADVDTGADFNHPDLAGKLIPGAAFINSSNGVPTGTGQAAVQDGNGHGTMTTGIMLADTNNAIGIAGVAPAAKALVVKVLDNRGMGNGDDVAAGIDYASSYPGVKVINLSLGTQQGGLLSLLLGPGPDPIPAAIDRAVQRGVMVAAAAGNAPGATSEYAGLTGEALVVGALNRAGYEASYSTNGNIYAPGGDGGSNQTPAVSVTSTNLGGGYAAGDGTSYAAPQVAGVVALLMAKGYSSAGAMQQILTTAANRNGLPELDAAAALGTSGAAPCAPGGTASGGVSPSPVRPAPTHPKPAPPVQAPAAPAALAAPSPAPSQEVALVEPSPTPPAPVSGTLAVRARPPKVPVYWLLGLSFAAREPLGMLALAVAAGAAAGYGALVLIKTVARE